jgi:predicted peroxiredoxin
LIFTFFAHNPLISFATFFSPLYICTMKPFLITIIAIVLLSACGGKESSGVKEGEKKTDTSTATVGDTALPKGMEIPTVKDSVEVVTDGRPGAIVRITHPSADAFTVCAALKTAEELSGKYAVLVYFDLRGVETVLKDSPDFEFAPYPKAKGQIKKLKSMGVSLYASRTALAAFYKKPEDLMDGVKISDPAEVISFTDGKIVTLEF